MDFDCHEDVVQRLRDMSEELEAIEEHVEGENRGENEESNRVDLRDDLREYAEEIDRLREELY